MLTERQKQAAARRSNRTRRMVWAYVSARPHASVKEISYALGWSSSPTASTNGNVVKTLQFLRAAGYIDYCDHASRTRTILVPFIVQEHR